MSIFDRVFNWSFAGAFSPIVGIGGAVDVVGAAFATVRIRKKTI